MAFRKFSLRLARAEEAARTARAGLWQTDFKPPWQYRAHRGEVAAQEAPEGCPIKGNVNRDGERIYHTPWGSQWYGRTKISADQGERWFCSERQALDAGWRAPLRIGLFGLHVASRRACRPKSGRPLTGSLSGSRSRAAKYITSIFQLPLLP
jgi:hypothetical protein